jgi:hypothetical protein
MFLIQHIESNTVSPRAVLGRSLETAAVAFKRFQRRRSSLIVVTVVFFPFMTVSNDPDAGFVISSLAS